MNTMEITPIESKSLRFVARRAGLAGKTDLEFAQADMVASKAFPINLDHFCAYGLILFWNFESPT